jgi:hypothetical protein
MNPIIEFLKEKNLLGKSGPIIQTIESLSLNEFVEIAKNIEDITINYHKPVFNSVSSHSVSSGLSGDSSECSYIGCRIERITNLARFSVLYSDKVFINNFLTAYTDIDNKSELNFAKNSFIEDLLVINTIKPIIDQGFIEFFAPERKVCFSCQAKQFLGDQAGKKFNNAYNKLKIEFLNNMSVKAWLSPESIVFDCNGPAPYFDHEKIHTSSIIPEILLQKTNILNKLKKGETITVSKSLIKELDLNTELAHQIVSDTISCLASSSSLKTSFLTDNDLHISFLNGLQHNYEISRRNQIAEKYLTTIVPFLDEIKLTDLIKLRKREEEAFVLFRKSINNSIDEISGSSDNFSEKDAKSIYSDIIVPSLANLDIKVKKAKKDLITKPIRSLIGVAGVLSFGLITGIISSNVSEIIKALGLLKFGTDFIKDSIAIGDGEKEISNDNYYFLWKMRKIKKN